MKPVRILLVALAALRLTRLITSDHLGEWYIVGPLKRWAWRRGTVGYSPSEIGERVEAVPTPPHYGGWRARLVKGLDCPFCVGFWIGALVLFGELLAGRSPRWLRGAWSFGLGALGLNYLVGHVSKRID